MCGKQASVSENALPVDTNMKPMLPTTACCSVQRGSTLTPCSSCHPFLAASLSLLKMLVLTQVAALQILDVSKYKQSAA